MKKQRPNNSLTAILQQSEGELHKPEPVAKNQSESKRPACRAGKKVAMCHIHEDVHIQLEYLRIETRKTKQELLCDALNLLFVKHDKPPIAS